MMRKGSLGLLAFSLRVAAMAAALIPAAVVSSIAQESAPSQIVARVGSKEISYREIRMPAESLKLKFRIIYGKSPETEADIAKLAALSLQTEKELLSARVVAIVYEAQVQRFRIIASEEETIAKSQAQLAGVDLEKYAAYQRDQATALMAALRATTSGEMTEEQAYKRFLSKYMTHDGWLVNRQYYSTPKRIGILEREARLTADDLRKPDAGVRALLVQEKLNERIDSEIAEEDPEFAQYKLAVESKNVDKIREIEKGNPNYLQSKRQLWWIQRYLKAGIRIMDKKYQDVLQRLVAPPPIQPRVGTSK